MEIKKIGNKEWIKSLTLLFLGILSLIWIFKLSQVNKTGYIEVFQLKIDIIEGFMWGFFIMGGFLITWASTSMMEYDLKEDRIPLYYVLIVGLIISLCGIVAFENLIMVYIFIELSTFLAVGIVMIKDEEKNYKAGMKYLLLSLLASSILLMGLIILYNITSSIMIDEIGIRLNNLSISKDKIFYSFILILIGIGIKSALFPFHIWLPDAHGSAPAPSSAILSGLVLKSYIILFIKIIYKSYGLSLVQDINVLPIILILGLMAMIYGSIMAIMEKDLKRIIAYSSVAQIGYIFMGIGLGNFLGLQAAIFHILAHGITKACLFLNAGSIIISTGNKDVEKISGIGRKMPITMGLFTICALSMVGIPLFVGFNSKWNFALSIMDSKYHWSIAILILSSLLNGVYYLPIIIKAFFSKGNDYENIKERSLRDLTPIIILGFLVIFFGLFSDPVMKLIASGLNNI